MKSIFLALALIATGVHAAAIIKAALAVRSRRPAWKIVPEIMVPLVGEEKELAFVKSVIDKTARKIIK